MGTVCHANRGPIQNGLLNDLPRLPKQKPVGGLSCGLAAISGNIRHLFLEQEAIAKSPSSKRLYDLVEGLGYLYSAHRGQISAARSNR